MSASSLGYSMYAGSFSLLKKSFRTGTKSWHFSHSADAKKSIRIRFSRIPMISRSVLSSSWSQLFSTRTRSRNRSTMMEDRNRKLWRGVKCGCVYILYVCYTHLNYCLCLISNTLTHFSAGSFFLFCAFPTIIKKKHKENEMLHKAVYMY